MLKNSCYISNYYNTDGNAKNIESVIPDNYETFINSVTNTPLIMFSGCNHVLFFGIEVKLAKNEFDFLHLLVKNNKQKKLIKYSVNDIIQSINYRQDNGRIDPSIARRKYLKTLKSSIKRKILDSVFERALIYAENSSSYNLQRYIKKIVTLPNLKNWDTLSKEDKKELLIKHIIQKKKYILKDINLFKIIPDIRSAGRKDNFGLYSMNFYDEFDNLISFEVENGDIYYFSNYFNEKLMNNFTPLPATKKTSRSSSKIEFNYVEFKPTRY